MKIFALSMALAAALAQTASDRPPTRNVGSMSDLMVKIIYPTSDALFYIESRTPKTDAEWTALEGQMLMLAESANLLMMPGRARDQKQWMADAKLMLDAGAARGQGREDEERRGGLRAERSAARIVHHLPQALPAWLWTEAATAARVA